MIQSLRKLGVILAALIVLAFGNASTAQAHGWYGHHHHHHGWYGHSHHHGGWYDDDDYDDHYVTVRHYSHRHYHSYDRHRSYGWGGRHSHYRGCGCW